MIAGLEAISQGEIAIDGQVVNKLEPRSRGCAMVFQNYALYPHMSVAENIGYALKVSGVPKPERERRILETAKLMQIQDYLERKPGQLSGGQRQRVAMGRAIIREPRVFLFDEPLSNLDAKLRVQMRLEIRHLHQRLDATSIFVTHDQVEAMTLADKLVVMNDGVIEQIGKPTEIYGKPASWFVGSFLGSPPMNFLEGHIAADQSSFQLEDGQNLRLKSDLIDDEMVAPKMAVSIGIRAEDISFNPNQAGCRLRATLNFAEELGMGRLLHGRIGNTDFVIHALGAEMPPLGREIDIMIPDNKIHIFKLETGERLDQKAMPMRDRSAA